MGKKIKRNIQKLFKCIYQKLYIPVLLLVDLSI